MLKIGEFSKLSHLTVKALRFYERKGILIPKKVDEQTGYRFYETSQLKEAARIKSYRQLGLTIEELQATNKGINLKEILISKAESLKSQKEEIEKMNRYGGIYTMMLIASAVCSAVTAPVYSQSLETSLSPLLLRILLIPPVVWLV